MKLRHVPPPFFWVDCHGCGKIKRTDHVVADLDGEPFKAYYCEQCAAGLRALEVQS